jgi:hypothetical protein
MRRAAPTSLLLAVLLSGCLSLQPSPQAEVEEFTLKAVFLERFTRFIEWPDESQVSNPERPFILGVMGNKDFVELLISIYKDKSIRNKKVSISIVKDLRDISACHLLYIAESQRKHLQEILAVTRNKPILTVSESEGFAQEGVLINFFIKDGRLCFEINELAATNAKLKMSHLLLETAKVVFQTLPGTNHV